MRTCVLLCLLTACSAPATDPAPAPEPTVEFREPEILVQPPDEAMITPFGRAYDALDEGLAQLLYPALLANSAPAEDLKKALPLKIGDYALTQSFAGIHEDPDASWVGALGIYRGAQGRVTLAIRDTGWDPTSSNMLRAAAEDALPDGRWLARSAPVDRGGRHVQAGIGGSGRMLLMAHRNGDDEAPALALLTAVDPKPLAALEASTALARGAWPASPKQPDPEALTSLAAPATLAAALPEAEAGWTVVADGHGFRRDEGGNIVAVATRTWSGERGVARATVTDLGPADAPVVAAERAWSSAEGADPREAAEGARCSEELASCKWATVAGDRFLLELATPAALGEEGTATWAKGFGTPAAP